MYISGKKLVEMIRTERENGLTDNEIYAKISQEYSPQKFMINSVFLRFS